MRRSTLWVCALLAIATLGCDRIKQAIDKRRGKTRPTPAQTARPQPATPAPVPAAQPAPAPAQPAPRQVAGPPRPLRDEPYASEDTGTIAPGMTEREVYSLWGAPAAVRRSGEYTYLFFRNGCEYSCGTFDLVTLQNGQVIDAVVRWPGHGYSGESSSPPERLPVPNTGDTLPTVPPPTPEDR